MYRSLEEHFRRQANEDQRLKYAASSRFSGNVMNPKWTPHGGPGDPPSNHNLNDIDATWVKAMVSTMLRTKHMAPWGTHPVVYV